MKRRGDLEMTVDFWRVLTDAVLVMLLILVLFIFAQFLANTKVLARLIVEQRQKEFTEELRKELGADADNVTVVVDGNAQRIRFSDTILFDKGDDQLKDAGKRVLRVVGQRLLVHPEWVSAIQIEGHTDVRKINKPRFPSNWELSSARATSVVRFLHEDLQLDPGQHPIAATGRGQYVPLKVPPPGASPEAEEEAYKKNRRIEMILTYVEVDVLGYGKLTRQNKDGAVPARAPVGVGTSAETSLPEASVSSSELSATGGESGAASAESSAPVTRSSAPAKSGAPAKSSAAGARRNEPTTAPSERTSSGGASPQ